MKNYFLALIVAMGTLTIAQSCEKATEDETYNIQMDSPDPEDIPRPGCGDGNC